MPNEILSRGVTRRAVLGGMPGCAVVVAVMALNLLGDGLRDAADPYNK